MRVFEREREGATDEVAGSLNKTFDEINACSHSLTHSHNFLQKAFFPMFRVVVQGCCCFVAFNDDNNNNNFEQQQQL